MSRPIGWKKQFCIRNHDTFYLGRDSAGHCLECRKEFQRLDPIKDSRIQQFCPKGHDTFICGRHLNNGQCNLCRITYAKQYKIEYKNELNRKRKERLLTDAEFKLSCNLRTRLNVAIKNNQKIGSAIRDLGCSIDFLKQYLESKFLPGMTWENHGLGENKWHIDHIIPLSFFDLTNLTQFKQAVHYTNLQPLWQVDNFRKNSKI